MILEKAPYIRVWANLFNVKSKTNRRDFAIDFFLHLIIWASVICLLMFTFDDKSFKRVTVSLILLLFSALMAIGGSISLIGRRLNDIGYKWQYSFLILIPLVSLVIIAVCLFKKGSVSEGEKKNFPKALETTVIIFALGPFAIPVLIFVAGMVLAATGGIVTTSKNIDEFDTYLEKVPYANEFIPDYRIDIGNYSQVQFGYKKTSTFFQSEGITLIASYDEVTYVSEKQKSLEKYYFLEEPVVRGENYIFPVTTFEYEGYTFKIAPKRDYWTSGTLTCKSFMMLGHNDLESKIAYLYFYDIDIDYLASVSDSKGVIDNCMPKLIKDYYVWF